MHATPKSAVATTAAVDLAKDVFELAFADADRRVVERRRLTRTAFARAFDNRVPMRIVMEACGSAHYWARRFARLGHTVELLPAHDVRPTCDALAERIGHNKAAVALANKQARRLWAAEHHRKAFDPDHVSVHGTPNT